MSETELAGTLRLPVIFLRNTIVFPGVTRPIKVGRPKSLAVAKLAGRERKLRLALVTQIVAEVEDPGIADLFPIGVEAESLERKKISATRATLLTLGIRRIRLLSLEESEGILWGNFEEVPETVQDEVEAQGLAMAVRCSAKELLSHSPDAPTEATFILDQIRNPGQLADMVAANLESSIPEEMELLNILDVPKRLREVLKRLHHALETQKVKEHIGCRVKSAMDKHQREFVLQQQIRAIQGELGETDEDDEVAEFAERIAKAGMPDEVEEVARKELTRLQRIPIQSPEHTVNRTYLEWLLDLPWSRTTEDHLDLKRARRILNEDHYGLDNVTKRIIEYLAVRSLKPDKKGPILCLVGPPGVGKTSTGRSVARALGREFVRASLGGMCDEAEIRGHRRTYVGALPGRILQGIKRAGTRNPVFVLDEIDKLGSDFWGDPSSALLEVLDPDQNHSFSDHYLQVSFDLSQVLFFATANEIDPIPQSLKDRLEILELSGYTRSEKLHIARNHLIPRQVQEHGLSPEQLPVQDEVICEVIGSYTREAGVRNLERELASICRNVAVKVASDQPTPERIGNEDLFDILGPAKFLPETAERTEIPGVATGLAWTPFGGQILFVEATRMQGGGKLILTGHLGDVMKESAQAALSFARANAASLGLEVDFFSHYDLHIHVPAGAIRKDGPSSGITMMTALVSLLSERCVCEDLAMTGEISLRGAVLPVIGVKEKVLAAHRAGIQRVLLPERNRKDLVNIPGEIQESTEIICVSTIEEAIELALEPAPEHARGPYVQGSIPDAAALHVMVPPEPEGGLILLPLPSHVSGCFGDVWCRHHDYE